ncbi:sulfur carrier protein [Corynebacterium mucifaciens]|uniref:Thiamine biosynthesis protein ThiS n=1 Tax=Corynebacterium ureicelerivorans TaxID=401472 RepID=A0A077HP18_9CORY|nr:sulfur carrier protein ThiS [Corynebacterium ureicelerivorans]AIL96357.1 thiamine biosynthesis protein ThiS [Corynebacterium ureicelerivorans]MDN8627283.1 sulfur carrier protein ThiS [Corynebacterium ureicelerivorans]
MNITLNGAATTTDAATVEALVAEVGAPADGTAVAIDGEVVPRSQWGRKLHDGAVADILTAVQGG